MRVTDTIGAILKHKGAIKVLSIAPEQSVHEALALMSKYDIGALMVMSGHVCSASFPSATTPAKAFFSATTRARLKSARS